jgi:RNA polymerase sigma factor (sigma-70 family)
MPGTPFTAVVSYIKKMAAGLEARGLDDRVLLGRFVELRDERAFAQLVERHGGLVMGVCRRLLQHAQEAEDAYQATFMVLAQKAGSIHKRSSLSSWLHGVAHRVSLKARTAVARRRGQEMRALSGNQTQAPLDLNWQDVGQVVDDELGRLPEKYRAPLLMCYLEGKTQDEAARALGWNVDQLRGRLDRGRQKLRDGLIRRGVSYSGGLLVGALATDVATASAPLLASTVKAALSFNLGHAGSASPLALTLARAILHAITAAKVKAVVSLGFAACILTVGATVLTNVIQAAKTSNAPGSIAIHAPAEKTKEKKDHIDILGDPLPPGAIARLGTMRLRPGGKAEYLAFSPDGKRLASWSGRLSIWDTGTGRELRQVNLPGARVLALTWLADGKGAAAVDLGENHFYLWDFTDPKAEIPPILGEPRFGMKIEAGDDKEHFHGFAIAPNGKLLAAGKRGFLNKERSIHVWELATGRRLEELAQPRILGVQSGNCDAVAFTPDSKSLLVFSGRPVWNVNTFKENEGKGMKLGVRASRPAAIFFK